MNELRRPIVVFGAGGAAAEISDLIRDDRAHSTELVYVVSDSKFASTVGAIIVHALDEIKFTSAEFVVAVGDPNLRASAWEALRSRGWRPLTLVHRLACVSPSANVGQGAIICAGAIISANTNLGNNVYINHNAVVSHDVRVGHHSVVSPGAVLGGNVTLADQVFIGLSASVKPGTRTLPVTIGTKAQVGAGACVIRDVEPGTTVVGVPARQLALD